jgi:hypothetical protein
MKTLTRAGLAFLAIVAAGCSAGYPSTEERIENVDETIQKNQLTGESDESRDKRFTEQVKPGGTN